jgi:predicted nucleic-acid-binding protein
MSPQGGSGNLILVHEPHDIVCHMFHVERLVLVRVSEITLIQNVHVTVIQNLIIIKALNYLEKIKPSFEDYRIIQGRISGSANRCSFLLNANHAIKLALSNAALKNYIYIVILTFKNNY